MKKKVAVWGPNWWCNFGDDLQSVVIALHLKEIGVEPVVYKLDQSIADEFGLTVANTIDELLDGAGLCFIAGGALLTPTLVPKQFLLAQPKLYAQSFDELHKAARKYDSKVCAISIGGDGKTRNRWIWYSWSRNSLFASKYFIDGTVRLKGDIEQMKSFGKSFVHHPDCLFAIRRFMRLPVAAERDPKGPIKIGFNLQKRHIPDDFLRAVREYAQANSDIEFYFSTTQMEHASEKYGIDYEYLPKNGGSRIKYVPYETPNQLTQFVADMDIFITSKLHLGFLGLLVGTPFLSYCGMGKARSFLKSLNADAAILSDDVSFDSLVAADGLLRKPKEELMKTYDMEILEKMISQSEGHYAFCTEQVEKYA